jgi:fibronectin-binding autotransporter adhesin
MKTTKSSFLHSRIRKYISGDGGNLLTQTLVLQCILAAPTMAAQFTWDTDSGTTGAQDGAGTWDTGTKFWNGTSTVAWGNTSADEAIFGNGGTAGAITFATSRIINKLTFNAVASGSYSLGGVGELRIQGTSPGITSNTSASITSPLRSDSAGTTTFTSNSGTLTLGFSRLSRNTGGARTFELGGDGDGAWTTGIINPHSDAVVSITKTGAGTWTQSGYNGYTGVTTISDGVLSTDRIGNPTTAVNNGTLLNLTTTAATSTVTLTSGSTTSLTVGQTVYNINIPGGSTIASITSATTFVLSSGTGVVAGTSQPAVFGEASGLGLATADASNLVFNGTGSGGTLKYTGATKDTGRAFTINANKIAKIEVTNSSANLSFVGATGAATNGALTKLGAGTLTLTGTNTYTGATTVNAGKLAIGTAGSLANTAVTVGGASATGTPTLAGGGTIAGATVIAAAGGGVVGIHAPGVAGVSNGVGSQTFSSTLNYQTGSIFEWDLSAISTTDPGVVADGSTGTYDQVVANGAAGSVTGTGAVFQVVLGGNAFTDVFWNTNKSWANIFSGAGTPSNLASIFTSFSNTGGLSGGNGTVTGQGQFTFTGSSLNWTAVPEPTSALAGLLIGAGLLRRRRNA